MAPEASGLGSGTLRILHLFAGGSHVAHADANKAGTGRSHTQAGQNVCGLPSQVQQGLGPSSSLRPHNRLTHAGRALPFPEARVQMERK